MSRAQWASIAALARRPDRCYSGRVRAGRGGTGGVDEASGKDAAVSRVARRGPLGQRRRGRLSRLGGLDLWVMIRGESVANPALIMLHGGPGPPSGGCGHPPRVPANTSRSRTSSREPSVPSPSNTSTRPVRSACSSNAETPPGLICRSLASPGEQKQRRREVRAAPQAQRLAASVRRFQVSGRCW
jgi:hypothetical protein